MNHSQLSSIPNTFSSFLWYFSKKYKYCLIGFILIALVWATNLSLIPFALKLIINGVSNWNGQGSLFSIMRGPALLYVGLVTLSWTLFRFYDWLTIKTYPSMQYKIREEMFCYVENHSYNYFQNNFAGSLANKINDMARSTSHVIPYLIDYFLSRFLALVIGTVTMFFVHPYFAGALLLWSIIFLTTAIILSKKAQKYAEIFSEARSTVVGKVVDSIGNILNVKLFAREKYEHRYLCTYLEDCASKDCRALWYLFKVKIFYAISVILLISVMVWLLIQERQNNHISVGDFALILTLTMWLIEEIFFLANQLVPFQKRLGRVNRPSRSSHLNMKSLIILMQNL